MTNVFLSSASEENINASIKRKITINEIKKYFLEFEFNKILAIVGDKEEFNCWAMTESSLSYFKKMQQGDLVLLKVNGTGKFKFIAQVLFKTDAGEELGRTLWPYVRNKSWKYLYFFRGVKEINIDCANLMTELGHKRNDRVEGINYENLSKFKQLLNKEEYKEIKEFIENLWR